MEEWIGKIETNFLARSYYPPSRRGRFLGYDFFNEDQRPVFRKPISANPGLNFNLGFYTSLFDSLFGIIFSTLYGASNHQTVEKKNSTEFSLKASRAEIRFHTNPGLSKPSFEQPSPDL